MDPRRLCEADRVATRYECVLGHERWTGTGVEPATSEEKAFLRQHPGYAVRATGTMFGHTLETQFPLGLALAALSLSRGALFPANDPTGTEVEKTGAPDQIVVVGAGHWQGEGMALVEAVK